MKITSLHVDVVKHTLPTKEPVPFGPRGSIAIVRIETDEGIMGIGDAMTHCFFHEAGVSVKTLIERGFKPLIIGEDPLEFRRLWNKMYLSEMYTRQRGLALDAISAIDTALLDIAGKKFGVPIYKLLGGHYHDRIKAYASDVFDMQNPENTIELVRRVLGEGFTGVKLGYGGFGLDLDESEEIIKVIRDTFGYGFTLMVDGPSTLAFPEALKLGRKLEKFDVFWWEEPLLRTDIEGYVELSRALDLNIAAGEELQTVYGFKDWIVRNALDIIQPDVHVAGGLSECKRIADLAEQWNTLLVPHSWSSAINLTAALHLVASLAKGFFVEYRTAATPLMSAILKDPPKVEDGYIRVPDKPGLGIELNEQTIEKYRI